MEEIFMINQLMAHLSNTMKSEKYQQDRVMITQLVVYQILPADLSKQKALDADSRAIQQIIFIKVAADNTRVIIYYSFKVFKRNNKSFVTNING